MDRVDIGLGRLDWIGLDWIGLDWSSSELG
jgi:hypothetical protein